MYGSKACSSVKFAHTKLYLDNTDMASGFQELPSVEKSLVYTRVYLLMILKVHINRHLPICLVYRLPFPVNEQFGILSNISLELCRVTLAQCKLYPQCKISKGENENLAHRKQHT